MALVGKKINQRDAMSTIHYSTFEYHYQQLMPKESVNE